MQQNDIFMQLDCKGGQQAGLLGIDVEDALNGELGGFIPEGDNGLTLQLTTTFSGQPNSDHLIQYMDKLISISDEMKASMEKMSDVMLRVNFIALKILTEGLHNLDNGDLK